ncbi:MAG TPA: hypothetical protein VGL21_16320 [Jatrophihabitantaceae bacterium]|jgi:hypothetical protein
MTTAAAKRLILGGAALAMAGAGFALSAGAASADTAPGLSLQITSATVHDVDHNGQIDPFDTVDYTFVATNNSAGPLKNLQINDADLGHITCPDTTIPSGMAFRCHNDAPHYLGFDAVDAGQFTTKATATATASSGSTVTSLPASSTIKIAAKPSLSLKFEPVKTVDVNHDGRLDKGDTISYSLLLTNTGNVTVNNVTVEEEKTPSVICPGGTGIPTDIPSGMIFRCLGSQPYTITQRDITNGQVINPAIAFGTAVRGGDVQASTDIETPVS